MCKSIKLILLSALFVLFLGLASVSAQSINQSTGTQTQESQAQKTTLLEIAQLSKGDSTTLLGRLKLRKTQAQAQVEHWQTIEQALKQEIAQGKKESTDLLAKLAEAEAELLKSQTALTEISSLLDASKADLTNLSKDFNNYKKASEDKIAKLEIKLIVYKGLGITIAVAGTVYAGYVIGKSYKLW
jgi:chromosome segregation ATPase